MSKETDIIDAIISDIAGITGAGYSQDLSGADRVVIGETFQPHRVPGVYVFPGAVRSSQGATTVLNKYDRQFMVQIEGWVAPENDSPKSALYAAMNLAADVRKALETNRGLSSLVHDVSIDMMSYDGAELQRPGLGAVILQMMVTFSERAGA